MSLELETRFLTPKRLASHDLFRGWTLDEIKRQLLQSEVVNFTKDEYIYRRGETSTSFYLINSGLIQLQINTVNGASKALKNLRAGEAFGDAELLMAKPYRADAQATTAVQLVKINKSVFFHYLAQQPHLFVQLISTLSESIYDLLGDVLTTNLLSGTQRVIHYLLGDLPLKNGASCMLTRPKAQIAASLNLTPEHFSRILHDLSTHQFIQVSGRHIVFLDMDGLCAYQR